MFKNQRWKLTFPQAFPPSLPTSSCLDSPEVPQQIKSNKKYTYKSFHNGSRKPLMVNPLSPNLLGGAPEALTLTQAQNKLVCADRHSFQGIREAF